MKEEIDKALSRLDRADKYLTISTIICIITLTIALLYTFVDNKPEIGACYELGNHTNVKVIGYDEVNKIVTYKDANYYREDDKDKLKWFNGIYEKSDDCRLYDAKKELNKVREEYLSHLHGEIMRFHKCGILETVRNCNPKENNE